MSLLRADKLANQLNNGGPIIVGPSTVSGDFIVSNQLTALGIGVTNDVVIGGGLTAQTLNITGATTLNDATLSGQLVADGKIKTNSNVGFEGEGDRITGIVTNLIAGDNVTLTSTQGTGVNNKGQVRIDVPRADTAEFADKAGLATDIEGGSAGRVLYQAGNDDTDFTDVGTNLQILQSTGAGKPIWVDPVATVASFADTSNFAAIATDISGGNSGQILIQVGPDDTDFLQATNNFVLLGQGTNDPIFVDPNLRLNVAFAKTSGITTNIQGGSAGKVVVQIGENETDFTGVGNTGDLLVSQGENKPIFTSPDDLNVSFADTAGISTNVIGGVASVTSLDVSGITTLGVTTITGDLLVSGITTLGLTTITDNLNVSNNLNVTQNLTVSGDTSLTEVDITNSVTSGISSVGSAVTITAETGRVDATKFRGDGSELTDIVDTLKITNVLYVTVDGDDNNDGRTRSTAKRTVGAAVSIAKESTVVRVSAGNYVEDNPIFMPEQTTILGDSLREVSMIPKNRDKDFIYVGNGNYVENVSFTGTLDEGKAIISFNPEKPSYVLQGPYIRNCTNFIANSIGMKIDGSAVIGDTRAMNVDSYTQLNQGGIGVSISNEGYAQLVSIFTIYNDQSIVCINGGVCDLTNSNSSFGRLGLVADGLGPQNFTGLITNTNASPGNGDGYDAETDVFAIDIGQPTREVSNAIYDNTTGLTTFTTSTDHGFNVGMSVTVRNLRFSCDSADVVREVIPAQEVGFNISTAQYTESTGIMTVTTTIDHNFDRRSVVELSGLRFICNSGSGDVEAIFPPSSGDNNGPSTSKFIVDEIPASDEFVINVGVSTIVHEYQGSGIATMRPSVFGITTAAYTKTTGIMTVTTDSDHNLTLGSAVILENLTFECDSGGGPSQALFPPSEGDNNGPVTSRFSVQEIPEGNVFVVEVGVGTIAHDYISGGTATNTPFYGITTALYDRVSGILTVTTDVNHNFSENITVKLEKLVFECDSGSGLETAFFPPAQGDGNGADIDIFDVIKFTPKTFEVNVGPSTIAHGYIEGGKVSISTEGLFPSGRFGSIFTVNEVENSTTFNAYTGFSTYPSDYVSGGEVETFIVRPYDGQVVYFDELYDSIDSITITDPGSGYTQPPLITIDDPSEPWGITSKGVVNISFDGKVTGVDLVSNGRGYFHGQTVNVTIDPPPGAGVTATAVVNRTPTYYVVSEATSVVNGISTVTFTERLPYSVGLGTTVPFFKQSRVLASSQAFEYIGAGNTALLALPQRGGIVRPENEVVNLNGGLVIYTSTDQAGNFKIGDGVTINQLSGSITGDDYERSLFATITPFILALGGE